MRVLRAEPRHWPLLRDIRLRALATDPRAFGSTLEREQAFDERTWRDRLARGATFLAMAGETPVGIATGLDIDGTAMLLSVWAAPEARGTGAGRAVVDAVITWATAEGHPRLTLWVGADNDAAQRLYLRAGFTPTGRRRAARDDGVEVEFAQAL